jgi:hypothetical protein
MARRSRSVTPAMKASPLSPAPLVCAHAFLVKKHMSSHPLFNDTVIPLSVTLAATLGLEDALLLTVIHEASRQQGQSRVRLRREFLRQQLAFWDDSSIRRILASLIDKGLLALYSPMYPESNELIVDMEVNAHEQAAPLASAASPVAHQRYQPQPAAPNASYAGNSGHTTASPRQPLSVSNSTTPPRHGPLHGQWQPSPDCLARLQQHGIQTAFIWTQLDAFLLQGQEQGANRNDWNTRFFRFVKSQWVYAQNDASRQQRQQEEEKERTSFRIASDEATPISGNWRPSEDAMHILQRSGIELLFIEDAIPEFVLYWRERGDAVKTWNSKFIQHIRQQWARYSASMERSTLPLPITTNWQPSQDCYDILVMAHIDAEFARRKVAEFVLYWRDSGQVHNSWNSRFLQYVKQEWAKQLNRPTGEPNGQASARASDTTAHASLDQLLDNDW